MAKKTFIIWIACLLSFFLPVACGGEQSDLDKCKEVCDKRLECYKGADEADLEQCLKACERIDYVDGYFDIVDIECADTDSCEDFKNCELGLLNFVESDDK